MFVLQLNDMRSSNIENIEPVARAETAEALEKFMAGETVEGYKDGNWGKCHRAGGPLEWFNKPFSMDQHIVDVGTVEDWVRDAAERYENNIMSIHSAD